MSDLATIILAAGKGTRMRSEQPKVLHPVAGEPLLSYPVEVARQLKSQKTIVVLGHGMERVTAWLKDVKSGAAVRTIEQRRLLGTADAVKTALTALKTFSGDVLILYGDVPLIRTQTLRSLLRFHRSKGHDLSLLSAHQEAPDGYGRILRDKAGNVRAIVEERDATAQQRKISEINSGILVVSRKRLAAGIPKIKKNGRKGEYYLTDLVHLLVEQGETVAAYCLDDVNEVLGVNSRVDLAVANQLMRDRINRGWMEKGVTFVDPASAYVDHSVVLAPDVVLGPSCVLRGQTIIKRDVRIDAGCVLTDARVDSGTHVAPYSILESCQVASNASIGPFARLRPETHVEAGARVGNFVELKKTRLGKGAKANHLSYLGNATIGANTNIGAGTITCNYDGARKAETRIGPRSFIGSDTQLVAPVKLGADSWVGAGTTVTRDVPPGALALSRVEQVNIKNWNKKQRKKKK